jgi:hypothetical protein
MIEQKNPTAVLELAEYQRRKKAESPCYIWYKCDDTNTNDIYAVDRQETCIEYACDEDVAEIGQSRIYQQCSPTGAKWILKIEYPAKLRMLLTLLDGAHQFCTLLYYELESRPGLETAAG